jgi:L-ascorbate metabolism protein UlaG (beta-lactamase superfamily)
MTDGFFSRPSLEKLLTQPVMPHRGRIEAALEAAHLTRAAAIFVAQSHHDHAMDTPYVAQMTAATIVGSRSTKNIALGSGFPADRIETIEDGSICRFGAFEIRIFKTPHGWPRPYPGEIAEPLRRSAWIREYKEGGNFTFHVAHPWGSVLIVPSTGVRQNWAVPLPAQIVFLGIGGPILSVDQLRPYWRQFVTEPRATSVYPIHWDYIFAEFDRGLSPKGPGRLRKKLKYLRPLAPDPTMIKDLPYAEEISLSGNPVRPLPSLEAPRGLREGLVRDRKCWKPLR